MTSSTPPAQFLVPRFSLVTGKLFELLPGLWKELGDLETQLYSSKTSTLSIEKPVYITSLARSGTTLLLEVLASHPHVATHQYRDFPFLFTPIFWERFLSVISKKDERPRERAHADKMMVTSFSPEAFEEMLWMHFFPDCHSEASSVVLTSDTRNKEFERCYREHIKKLLLLRNASRYVAKGNYHVSRLGYLQKLFPDARFVIPIRSPESHIASLQKQHQLFVRGQESYPSARLHLKRSGHFEFGKDRKVIHFGNDDEVARIVEAWDSGEEVHGWALYWKSVYSYLITLLEDNPALRQQTLLLSYEKLCSDSHTELRRLFSFLELEAADSFLNDWSNSIQQPTYYKPVFSDEEKLRMHEITADVNAQLAQFT